MLLFLLNKINIFSFQFPATPIMEGIIDLHNYIFFCLILVFVFVLLILWVYGYLSKNPVFYLIIGSCVVYFGLFYFFESVYPYLNISSNCSYYLEIYLDMLSASQASYDYPRESILPVLFVMVFSIRIFLITQMNIFVNRTFIKNMLNILNFLSLMVFVGSLIYYLYVVLNIGQDILNLTEQLLFPYLFYSYLVLILVLMIRLTYHLIGSISYFSDIDFNSFSIWLKSILISEKKNVLNASMVAVGLICITLGMGTYLYELYFLSDIELYIKQYDAAHRAYCLAEGILYDGDKQDGIYAYWRMSHTAQTYVITSTRIVCAGVLTYAVCASIYGSLDPKDPKGPSGDLNVAPIVSDVQSSVSVVQSPKAFVDTNTNTNVNVATSVQHLSLEDPVPVSVQDPVPVSVQDPVLVSVQDPVPVSVQDPVPVSVKICKFSGFELVEKKLKCHMDGAVKPLATEEFNQVSDLVNIAGSSKADIIERSKLFQKYVTGELSIPGHRSFYTVTVPSTGDRIDVYKHLDDVIIAENTHLYLALKNNRALIKSDYAEILESIASLESQPATYTTLLELKNLYMQRTLSLQTLNDYYCQIIELEREEKIYKSLKRSNLTINGEVVLFEGLDELQYSLLYNLFNIVDGNIGDHF